MNTISITKPETNEVITYNETEVLRFIEDNNKLREGNVATIKDIINLRTKVYEFFNEGYTAGDTEITSAVDEVNYLLESIGADQLTRTWSASLRIYVNVTGIEGSDADDIRNKIQDDINVEFQSVDGDLWVDDIEVHDIVPE